MKIARKYGSSLDSLPQCSLDRRRRPALSTTVDPGTTPAPAYYPPSSYYRSGLVIGGSIGFGGLTANRAVISAAAVCRWKATSAAC